MFQLSTSLIALLTMLSVSSTLAWQQHTLVPSVPAWRTRRSAHTKMRMDTEGPPLLSLPLLHRPWITNPPRPKSSSQQLQEQPQRQLHTLLDDALTTSPSIFSPFLQHQLSFLSQTLPGWQPLPVLSRNGQDMSFRQSTTGSATLRTLQFRSRDYRLIRLTLLQADQAQIFTSVMYPEPRLPLPLFACDLMQFGMTSTATTTSGTDASAGCTSEEHRDDDKPAPFQKMVCVVDLLPLYETEVPHAVPYEHLLRPIRDQYPLLQQDVKKRNFDPDRFSQQKLLGRASTTNKLPSRTDGKDDFTVLLEELYPAFQAYLSTHVSLVQQCGDRQSRDDALLNDNRAGLERQRLFDEVAASNNPACAMLAKYFGKEWADDYLHDVLFPLNRRC